MFLNFIKITDLTQFPKNHPSKHFCIELGTDYGNTKAFSTNSSFTTMESRSTILYKI